MKNSFGGPISRLDTDEEIISKPKDTSIETPKAGIQRVKHRLDKMEQNIQKLWDNHKRYNIQVRKECKKHVKQ